MRRKDLILHENREPVGAPQAQGRLGCWVWAETFGMGSGLAETIIQLIPESRSRIVYTGEADPQDDFRWEVSLFRAEKYLGYVPWVHFDDGLAGYAARQRGKEAAQHWWKSS